MNIFYLKIGTFMPYLEKIIALKAIKIFDIQSLPNLKAALNCVFLMCGPRNIFPAHAALEWI